MSAIEASRQLVHTIDNSVMLHAPVQPLYSLPRIKSHLHVWPNPLCLCLSVDNSDSLGFSPIVLLTISLPSSTSTDVVLCLFIIFYSFHLLRRAAEQSLGGGGRKGRILLTPHTFSYQMTFEEPVPAFQGFFSRPSDLVILFYLFIIFVLFLCLFFIFYILFIFWPLLDSSLLPSKRTFFSVVVIYSLKQVRCIWMWVWGVLINFFLFIMLLYSNRDIVMHFPRACVYDIIAILVNCQDVEVLVSYDKMTYVMHVRRMWCSRTVISKKNMHVKHPPHQPKNRTVAGRGVAPRFPPPQTTPILAKHRRLGSSKQVQNIIFIYNAIVIKMVNV